MAARPAVVLASGAAEPFGAQLLRQAAAAAAQASAGSVAASYSRARLCMSNVHAAQLCTATSLPQSDGRHDDVLDQAGVLGAAANAATRVYVREQPALQGAAPCIEEVAVIGNR